MKNETFDIKRFWNYTRYLIKSNWKTRSIRTLGFLFVYAIFLVFAFGSPGVSNKNAIYYQSELWVIISGLIIFGSSFPFLRKKESAIFTLMLPASNFEKFISELIRKYFNYLIIAPILYLVIFLSTLKFCSLTFENVNYTIPSDFVETIKKIYPDIQTIATLSILFIIGSTLFKSKSIYKTIASIGIAYGLIFLYSKLIVKLLKLEWIYDNTFLFKMIEEKNVLLFIIYSGFFIWGILYSYFRLKEKEV